MDGDVFLILFGIVVVVIIIIGVLLKEAYDKL